MSFPLALLFREWAQMRRFHALDAAARSIVFYAEDAASWVHLEPIIEQLTGSFGRNICYLTSDSRDPILTHAGENIRAFHIGDGVVRTSLFLSLRAGVLVTTMPDLQTFHIKRSKVHQVHYVYLFHSMVSTHMIYRKGAFDHYDTILCVGPHQVREIRETERLYGLKPKRLIKHGYGRLDTMLRDDRNRAAPRRASDVRARRVLVAPSWGPQGLLESSGQELTEVLLEAGYRVTVRPHPMTGRKRPSVIRELAKRFGDHPDFVLETDMTSRQSLADADIMVSDWSGAALEYAFAYERPVLFVDVPRKVNNPDYERVGCEPLEVSIRQEIGEVVSPQNLDRLPGSIEQLCADPAAFGERIRQVRNRTVYNPGTSGAVGAAAIAGIADEVMNQRDDG